MCKNDSEPSCIGYEVRLFDSTKFERYICSLCDRLLRQPIQTQRGEVACEQCYSRAYNKDEGTCPIDNEPSDGNTHRDKAKEREVLALLCWCSFSAFGCPWQGEVRNIEDHEKYCDYKFEKCRFCNEEMRLSDMDVHLRDCFELISQGCPIPGCKYKSKDAEELKKHLQEGIIYHSHLQSKQKSRIELEMESTQKDLLKEREQSQKEIAILRQQLTDMQMNMQKVFEKQEEKISLLENQLTNLLCDGETKKNAAENTEISKLSTDMCHLNKQLSDLDLRQQLFENTTFDGKLVWKIDNLEARIQQAKSGRVTALHSAPAFTDKHGYKFCARVYLNGDGLGRSTHVSLFFVLMKSEFDSRLIWPFNRSVKFRLINQECEGLDMIENFDPDQKSTSFRKPVKEMNIASGCPRFISIDSFINSGFVKDDCVFLEIDVGDTDLSTRTITTG